MSDGNRRDGSEDRRSFASRTPANSNPDGVTYRRGFVTRHQVSGWRFVMRRIASGVAMHDTRMLVDPLRTQSRSVLVGALAVVTGLLACFVFSLIRPGGVPGNAAVLADRDTAAMYVRVNDELHAVVNLTSARLIVGEPVTPTRVRSAELDKFARGAAVGIPGAPERMVRNPALDADWTVCDGPEAPAAAGVSVIAGAPVPGGERAGALDADTAVLVDNGAGTWLLWNGRRSLVDIGDRGVTSALGIGQKELVARPISPGLFNAVPEGPPLRVPDIAGAGTPPQFGLPVDAAVGAVVVSYRTDGTMLQYAVLPDGLQPISPVLSAVLRNANSFGLTRPPHVGADDIARMPVSRLLDNEAYPQNPVTLLDPQSSPVICVRWTKPLDAGVSSMTLMSGGTLPVADGAHAVGVADAGAGQVFISPGFGYFVQTVGQEPAAPRTGSLFWVSDTGMRFGIDGGTQTDGTDRTVEALGLAGPPTPAPWSVLSLFAAGPALSKSGALTAYTGSGNR